MSYYKSFNLHVGHCYLTGPNEVLCENDEGKKIVITVYKTFDDWVRDGNVKQKNIGDIKRTISKIGYANASPTNDDIKSPDVAGDVILLLDGDFINSKEDSTYNNFRIELLREYRKGSLKQLLDEI